MRHYRSKPPSSADRVAAYPHLAAVLPAIVMPGMGVAGAAAAWLAGRHYSPVVVAQGRAAMDFQVTLLLAGMALFTVLTHGAGLPPAAPVPLLLALYFLSVVTPVFAATTTSRGEVWRYPLSLHLLDSDTPPARR